MPRTERADIEKIYELLTAPRYEIREALDLLKVGRTRFYRMVHEGEIEVTRSGRRVFVTRSSLARALAGTV